MAGILVADQPCEPFDGVVVKWRKYAIHEEDWRPAAFAISVRARLKEEEVVDNLGLELFCGCPLERETGNRKPLSAITFIELRDVPDAFHIPFEKHLKYHIRLRDQRKVMLLDRLRAVLRQIIVDPEGHDAPDQPPLAIRRSYYVARAWAWAAIK